jgi:hypothetical protein
VVYYCFTFADSFSCFDTKKLAVDCAKFSNMADENENTVLWVRSLCASQMGHGIVFGIPEPL